MSQSRRLVTAKDIYVPVQIEENDLYTGIYKVLKVVKPHWSPKNIKFKVFTDGITNKLVACQIDDLPDGEENIALVRIYGNKTDFLIDRHAEIRNIKTLNAVGLAPKIYGVFQNGLVYQYYPGVTLTPSSINDAKIWPLVAKQMAKMHKVQLGPEINKEPVLWDKIEQFLCLLPEPFSSETKQSRFVHSFGSITKLRIEFERLKSKVLSNTESPVVFAHNDLLLGNVIYNEDERTVCFIDYEYATYNYQAFDIANHFNEFVGVSTSIDYSGYPTEECQRQWISAYLSEYSDGRSPSKLEVDTVYKDVQLHSLTSHFLWGVWSLVQYELSDIDFDFGRYAEIRFNRYYETRDDILRECL